MQQQSKSTPYFKVADNVWGMKDVFVNFYMIQSTENNNWFLVDAGIKTSLPKIKKMAAALFGDKKPSAIILTHGHFDHIGALKKLLDEWHVPVYAHYLELPYLTNKSSYPPPDPTVGGGLLSLMSCLYPTGPADLGAHVAALPENGTVPAFEEWQYIHTPGHSFGHISLFRKNDKTLIAGDAFVTTKNESAIESLLKQTKKVSAPPAYFTPDWDAAYESVKKLASLTPEVVATGHGKVMQGEEMRKQLAYLKKNFYNKFVPQHGRYISEPAIADANGILYIPPAVHNPYKKWIVVGVTAAITAITFSIILSKRKHFA